MHNKLFTLILVLFVFSSCQKEKIVEPVLPQGEKIGVLVSNEGNFNWGNASLSLIEPQEKKIYNNVFYNANNTPLGDVLQSIYVQNNFAYLVVNNSQKIVKISLKDFKELAEYSGLTSPRYMVIHNNKAFVSDLYANAVSVVNLNNPGENSVIKQINVNGWTEEMDTNFNYLYVAGVSTNQVYVINMTNNLLVDSIPTSNAPMSVKFDKEGYLWVYCGDFESETYTLQRIDIATKEPVLKIELPANNTQYATKMTINADKNKIYLIYNGIKCMGINDTTLSNFISNSSIQTPYGIGIDKDGNIYIADAKDFVSEGNIYVYNKMGQFLSKYQAGIIPGSFAFYDFN